MKTIIKTEATLPCLEKVRKRKLSWEKFSKDCKEEYFDVREKATFEQNQECAYTGLWLGEDSSFQNHLDHFHLRSIYPKETFDWLNLFAAVHNKPYGSGSKDAKIKKNKKIADEQYKTFWSPLEPNLKEKFRYRTDGWMEPNPDLEDSIKEKATETIKIYHLNHPDLCRRREELIRSIQSLKDQNVPEEKVREAFSTSGFSSVIEFELAH